LIHGRLIFDGDCAFCTYWVRYWQRLTGDAVEYRSYQSLAAEELQLDVHACRRAVQWQGTDGTRAAAALASALVLAAAGNRLFLYAYRYVPGMRWLAEAVYRAIARRRAAAYALARALWGSERHPARYHAASRWFTLVLGLIYAAAFASLALQIEGLVGSRGVLPAGNFLHAMRAAYGTDAFGRLPSVFWWCPHDTALVAAAWLGVAAGLLVASGRAMTPALAVCYVLYLSFFAIGQDFMHFQWDLLLLECGFLALWLHSGSALLPFLFRLLLFRFMFLSGCVKLLSGDPSWAALAALDFHFETQPLPAPLAWNAHQLPAIVLRAGVVATFVIELVLPFLFFAPRRPRMLAVGGVVALQLAILATGNYNFFNLLTLSLCLFLLDDTQLRNRRDARVPRTIIAAIVTSVAVLVGTLNLYHLTRPFTRETPRVLERVANAAAAWRIVNAYGLFAVMTTTRAEIEIQGSADGRRWLNYEFLHKPGALDRALHWNIPHQPRLDWQMRFAALNRAEREPWFGNLLLRLLQNEPVVTALLAHNPFAHRAPRYVRAVLWRYRFTTRAQGASSARPWRRELIGLYHPALGVHPSANPATGVGR
jgi:predicted DCC family thiol-disulfide oxidoreductase YuxK